MVMRLSVQGFTRDRRLVAGANGTVLKVRHKGFEPFEIRYTQMA